VLAALLLLIALLLLLRARTSVATWRPHEVPVGCLALLLHWSQVNCGGNTRSHGAAWGPCSTAGSTSTTQAHHIGVNDNNHEQCRSTPVIATVAVVAVGHGALVLS
jgi:hypothetical protein